MDNKEKARILSTITKEQWEAIASLTQEQWEEVLNKSEGRILESEKFDEDKELKIKVMNIMKELGITANLKGYEYLIEAIICVYKDSSYKEITKKLYPHIANKFNTTFKNVERSIRHAINKVFDENDADIIDKYFSKEKCTNAEAIADLVNFVKFYQ